LNSYIKMLWKYYKDDGDFICRDKLIEHYIPFIKKLSRNIYSKLPNTIQLSEIESYANLGLLDALEKYNHKRGVEFEAYAKIRIKGAVYDEIRKQDWLPRSIRSTIKKQKNIISSGGEMENFGEKVYIYNEENNISLSEILLQNPSLSSLDSYDNLTESSLFEQKIDFVEELERKISINKLLLKLKKTDRKVIYLYYFEGRTFKEIGEIMCLTESRISQIHKKALANLKQFIGEFYF